MTDREALEQLLERFGLTPYAGDMGVGPTDGNAITLMAGEDDVGGYSGFYALFAFTDAGTFRALSIRE